MKRTIDKEIILLALLSCAWILGLVTGFLDPLQVMVANALETTLAWAVAFGLMGYWAPEGEPKRPIVGALGAGLVLFGLGVFPAWLLIGSDFAVDAQGDYTFESTTSFSAEGLAMCAALCATYLWIFFDRKRRLVGDGLLYALFLLSVPPLFTWLVSIPAISFFSVFVGAIVHELVRPTLHVLMKLAKMKDDANEKKDLTRVFFSPKPTKPAKKAPPARHEPSDTEMYEKFSAYGEDATNEPK